MNNEILKKEKTVELTPEVIFNDNVIITEFLVMKLMGVKRGDKNSEEGWLIKHAGDYRKIVNNPENKDIIDLISTLEVKDENDLNLNKAAKLIEEKFKVHI